MDELECFLDDPLFQHPLSLAGAIPFIMLAAFLYYLLHSKTTDSCLKVVLLLSGSSPSSTPTSEGQPASRKRRWGSSSSNKKKTSLSISTDSLKVKYMIVDVYYCLDDWCVSFKRDGDAVDGTMII